MVQRTNNYVDHTCSSHHKLSWLSEWSPQWLTPSHTQLWLTHRWLPHLNQLWGIQRPPGKGGTVGVRKNSSSLMHLFPFAALCTPNFFFNQHYESALIRVQTFIPGSCVVRPMWWFLNKIRWSNKNKYIYKKNSKCCTITLQGPGMLFTFNSWSHLTGPGNQANHHTAEQQGYSDLSHTRMNLVDKCATLVES